MVRRSSTETFERIDHIEDRIAFLQADLLDQASLIQVMEEARPGRDLQPGGPVLRADQLEPARPDRASSPAWA